MFLVATINLFLGTDSTPGFAVARAFTAFTARLLVMGADVLTVDLPADLGKMLCHFLMFLVATINLFLGIGSTPGFAVTAAFTVFIARLLVMGADAFIVGFLAGFFRFTTYFAIHTLLFQGLFILAGLAAMFGLLAFTFLVEVRSTL